MDAGVLEALRASGASWWQVVFQGVVPEKVNEMLSWTFIRFEINFVNAVAVGAVAGAGGIGYQLFLAGSFYYNIHEVGLIVYLCLAVAVVLEVAATKLRKRYIVQHCFVLRAGGRGGCGARGDAQSLKQSSLRCETRLVGTTPGPAAPKPLAC
ncbi:MAG: PhnE/PtxC family ABC transporter permease [Eggerthellaceae bacterium]